MAIDFDIYNVDDIVIAGIDYNDYPDFVDAYVESATRNGIPLTEEELDELNDLNETREWVNENAYEYLLDQPKEVDFIVI